MQEELNREAGARLRELRIAAGMSQEELSFAAALDQSTLSKVERLGPAAVGWGRFCVVVAALGHEVEVIYRPSMSTKVVKPVPPREPKRR